MRSYTITIAPDDQEQATTTLRVEVTRKGARITELLVRAGDGDGISAGQLPTVDLEQLVRAVVPATTPAKAIVDTAPKPTAEAEIVPVPAAAPRPAAQVTTTRPKAQPAEDPRTDRSAEATPAPRATKNAAASTRSRRNPATPRKAAAAAKSAAPAGSKARAAKATAVKSAKRATKKAAAATAAAGGRTYRRAPGDLENVLQQASTAAAVADHYGVPKHTAYGWIRNLRNKDTVAAAN